MNTDDLSKKIAMLTAIEDIKNLKATYCDYCDSNYDPEGLSNLFVEDGIWDGGPEFGKHVGKQAIHDFFVGASGSIVFAAHLVMNPIIKVNEESANGKWRLLMPCTVNNKNGIPESRWLLSAYTEQYVKVETQWLYKSLIVDSQFYAAHLDGWVNETT
jgi:hypothetical protein